MNLQDKLLNSLKCKNTHSSLYKLDEEKELEKIIPIAKDMKLVGECKYHVVNCFDHSLNALCEFESMLKQDDFFSSHLKQNIYKYLSTKTEEDISKLELLKLGIFMHDIGKPGAKTVDETGRAHFKGHEKIGAKEAYNIGEKLSLSQKSMDVLYKYIRYHMILLGFYKTNNMSQDKLYEIFDILKDEVIGVVLLGYADIVSTRKLLNPNENSGVIKTYMEYILTNYIYRYKRM